MRMPATMYAVTLGSRIRLVTRVAAKPQISMSAMETIITETVSVMCSFS